MIVLYSARVAAWRLARHHLDRPARRTDLLRVAADVLGIHAQVASAAELSLRARVSGLRAGDVAAAVRDDRTLVKTWAMRGTLHLVPAEELPLIVAATRTPQAFRRPSWLKGYGLTAAEMDALLAAIPEALGDGPLTREELADAVAARVHERFARHLRSGWGEFLKPAAFQGLLVFGPSRDRASPSSAPSGGSATGPGSFRIPGRHCSSSRAGTSMRMVRPRRTDSPGGAAPTSRRAAGSSGGSGTSWKTSRSTVPEPASWLPMRRRSPPSRPLEPGEELGARLLGTLGP